MRKWHQKDAKPKTTACQLRCIAEKQMECRAKITVHQGSQRVGQQEDRKSSGKIAPETQNAIPVLLCANDSRKMLGHDGKSDCTRTGSIQKLHWVLIHHWTWFVWISGRGTDAGTALIRRARFKRFAYFAYEGYDVPVIIVSVLVQQVHFNHPSILEVGEV